MGLQEELAEAKQRLSKIDRKWSHDVKTQGMGAVTRSVVVKVKAFRVERSGIAGVENHLSHNGKQMPSKPQDIEKATDKAMLKAINEVLNYDPRLSIDRMGEDFT